jgi:hypothetical protein
MWGPSIPCVDKRFGVIALQLEKHLEAILENSSDRDGSKVAASG